MTPNKKIKNYRNMSAKNKITTTSNRNYNIDKYYNNCL